MATKTRNAFSSEFLVTTASRLTKAHVSLSQDSVLTDGERPQRTRWGFALS